MREEFSGLFKKWQDNKNKITNADDKNLIQQFCDVIITVNNDEGGGGVAEELLLSIQVPCTSDDDLMSELREDIDFAIRLLRGEAVLNAQSAVTQTATVDMAAKGASFFNVVQKATAKLYDLNRFKASNSTLLNGKGKKDSVLEIIFSQCDDPLYSHF